MMDPTIVLIDKDRPNSETRYVYTDGRGFLPESHRFPMWYGESQGFWDGEELIIWTKSFKPWVMTHALPEYSDKLEVIERVKRIGDQILVDITLYDPEAFAFPGTIPSCSASLRIGRWRRRPSTNALPATMSITTKTDKFRSIFLAIRTIVTHPIRVRG